MPYKARAKLHQVQKLTDLRRASGLTYAALAQRSGLSKDAIRCWTHGRNCPTVANLEAVLNVLGYTLEVRPLDASK